VLLQALALRVRAEQRLQEPLRALALQAKRAVQERRSRSACYANVDLALRWQRGVAIIVAHAARIGWIAPQSSSPARLCDQPAAAGGAPTRRPEQERVDRIPRPQLGRGLRLATARSPLLSPRV
jgi:hypothetical protein